MADLISLNQLANASTDAQTLADAINGNDQLDVISRLGEKYPTLAKAIKTIMQKAPINSTPFATKAALIADTTLADGAFAFVYNDTDDNNGVYQKVASVWQYQSYNNPTVKITANVELYNTSANVDSVYVSNDGKRLGSASGWTIAAIPVWGGQTYVLQADAITNNTYIAVTYRTKADTTVGETNGILPLNWDATNHPNQRIFTTPTDAKMIFFSIKNASDLDITQNLSVKLLDQTTANKVVAINGLKIASTVAQISRLDNKKWCVIGDSITEHNFRTNKNYHDYIKDSVNNLIVYNYGQSGTGYYGRFNVADTIIETDIDIISVAFGTNDWGLSTKDLGAFLDTDTSATISACINICLQKLIAKFPTKKIVLFTPLPRADAFGGVKNVVNYTLEDLAQLIKKYADYYSLPCLDMLHQSNLHPWNATANDYYFKAVGYEADGLHPNDNGHKLYGDKVKAFLETI